MIQLSYKQQIAFNSLSIIAGNALYALTVVLFLVPSGLITGGATGIALGANRVLGLPVSGVLFAINISMLVLGWMVLGSRFALTTIASTILSPLFLALWERVFADFVLTDDLVLNTVFAGFGIGIPWASPSVPVPPPAAWTSLRWCSTSGSTCRCRRP